MPSYHRSFTYDRRGNRTTQTDHLAAETTTYTYDAANQLTLEETSVGNTTYTYDAAGRCTRQETPSTLTDYEYDALGRVTVAEPVSGPVTFTYNGAGQRMQKETPTETTRYLYDFKHLLAEMDGAGDTESLYTYAENEYGDLISQYDDVEDESSYFQYDAQWSTNALTDPSGDATDRWRYSAFGLADHTQGTSDTPHTYVGKQGYYQDHELSLYLLGISGNETHSGGRFYNPDLGRFLSPDPLGLDPDDLKNPYRYVSNNPINKIDPSGLVEFNHTGIKFIGHSPIDEYIDVWSRKGDYGRLAIATVDPDTRAVGYLGDEGCKRNRTFYEQLGTINWYRPPLNDNQITRFIPMTGDGVAPSKVLVPMTDVIAEIKKKKGAFDTREPLTAAQVEHNINVWWAQQAGIDPGAVADIQSPVGGLTAAGLLEAVKDEACEQMGRFMGEGNPCKVIQDLKTNCGAVVSGGGDVISEIISAIFSSNNNALGVLIAGVKGGFEKFSSSFIPKLGEALKTWSGLEDIDFGKLVTAFFPEGKLNLNCDGTCWKSLGEVLAEAFGYTFDSVMKLALEGAPKSLGFAISAGEAIFEFISKIGEGAQAIKNGVIDLIQAFLPIDFGAISDFFGTLKETLQTNSFSKIIDVAKDEIPLFIAKLVAKAAPGAGWISLAWGIIRGFVDTCSDLSSLLSTIVSAIKDATSGGLGVVETIAGKVDTALTAGLVPIIKFIASVISVNTLPRTIKKLMKQLQTQAQKPLKALLDLLLGAIKRIVGTLGERFGFSSSAMVFPVTEYSEETRKAASVSVNEDGDVIVTQSPSKNWSKLTDDSCKKEVKTEFEAVKTAISALPGPQTSPGKGSTTKSAVSSQYRILLKEVKALAKAIAERCKCDKDESSGRQNKCKSTARAPIYSDARRITFKDKDGNSVTGEFGERVTAYLTPEQIGKGKCPRTTFSEPPWIRSLRESSGVPFEKGHLLASCLTGEGGSSWYNWTPLFNQANHPAMSNCEDYLVQLVDKCGYCIHLVIKVEGYGRNSEPDLNESAKSAFPTRVIMEWFSDDGCAAGRFEIKNTVKSETPNDCVLKKLPCKE